MTGKITLLLIFILCVYGAKAQVADTTQQYDIFYSSPKTYELAGVRAVGGERTIMRIIWIRLLDFLFECR